MAIYGDMAIYGAAPWLTAYCLPPTAHCYFNSCHAIVAIPSGTK
jgi:hypothetical protein